MTSARPEEAGRARSLGPDRLRSLDGLRGVAALIVLVQHTLLSYNPVAEVFFEETEVGVGSPYWWLTYSPLHVLWIGEEAVLVFFVLSGLVLALPAVRRPVRWRSYFPKRLVRLYLPVWVALAIAVLLAAVVPREVSPEQSTYLNDRADLTLSDAWGDAVLVFGAGVINSPLWSLRWEVIFSVLLPAYLLLAGRSRLAWLLAKFAALLALIAVGTVIDSQALRFLPMFGVGVLMAYHLDLLGAVRDRIDSARRSEGLWLALALLTLLLITARWTVLGLPVESVLLSAAASGGSFLGAVLVVYLAMYWPWARDALETGPVLHVGVRSFSLYLIHEPVVVTTRFLLPGAVPAWASFAVCIALSILAAVVFYRWVEAPSHALAQRAGAAGASLRLPSLSRGGRRGGDRSERPGRTADRV